MRSVFANCGQVCLGTERVFVERPVFDEFVRRLKARAESLKLGHPNEPRHHHGAADQPGASDSKVLSYYKKAVEEGATVVTGGGIPDMPADLAEGCLGAADHLDRPVRRCRHRRARKSSGPAATSRPSIPKRKWCAAPTIRPTAWRRAIWTNDLSRAHRLAASHRRRLVWVNSWFLRDLRTPFGGSKQSGIGREGGVHSLEFYTELQNVCIKL